MTQTNPQWQTRYLGTTPASVRVKARDVKPYLYGLWCSIAGGPPFSNTICSVQWSRDGEHLFFGLDSHNFYKAHPDEEIELIPEPAEQVERRQDKISKWVLPPRPDPGCSVCGHSRPSPNPLEAE